MTIEICAIPEDCLREIISHLELKDLSRLGRTSKWLRQHVMSTLTMRRQKMVVFLEQNHSGFQNIKKFGSWNPKEEEIKCFDWLCDYGCTSFSFQHHQHILNEEHFKNVHEVTLQQWLISSSTCKHLECKPLMTNAPVDSKTWKESLCNSCGSIVISFDADDAQAYCERGRRYYSKGAFHKALEDFTNAIKIEPKNTNFLCYRGNTLCEIGQFRRALDDFEVSLSLSPSAFMYYNSAITLTNLGELHRAVERYSQAIEHCNSDKDKALYYNNRANIISHIDGDDKAMEDYSAAIRLDQKHPMFYINRASVWMNKKEYQNALSDYSKAIELNPNNPMYYSTRSNCSKAMNNLQAALTDINKSNELDSNNTEYIILRARIYCDMNQINLALIEVNLALQMNKRDGDALHLRGEIYARMNRLQEALIDTSKSVSIEPTRWRIFSLSFIYERLQNYQEAFFCYQKILQMNSKDSRALIHRGITLRNLKRYDDAILDFLAVLKLDAENFQIDTSQIYNHIGVVFYLKRDFNQSAEYFSHAIKLKPDNSQYWHNRGDALCAAKRFDDAISDLTTSLTLSIHSSSTPFTRSLLSFAYYSVGNIDRATHEVSTALALNPKQSRGHLVKGLIHMQKQKFEEAIKEIEIFFKECNDEEIPPIEIGKEYYDNCKLLLCPN